MLAADRSFFDAAMAHVDVEGDPVREKLALEAALDELVAAAQAGGEVRAGVGGIDVATLMTAATNTPTPSCGAATWR
jgi:antitoxin (DNA-binding transcriptional repressor) of toxin-antitoxin stability system